MHITSSRVIRVTWIALASALCAPAHAGQTDIFLKFPPIEGDSGKAQAKGDDHRNQIEILSWSWGASAPSSPVSWQPSCWPSRR